jgi:hypothetical protein
VRPSGKRGFSLGDVAFSSARRRRFPSEDQQHAGEDHTARNPFAPGERLSTEGNTQCERDHRVHERKAGGDGGARIREQERYALKPMSDPNTTRYAHAASASGCGGTENCSPSARESVINTAPPHNISLAKPAGRGASGKRVVDSTDPSDHVSVAPAMHASPEVAGEQGGQQQLHSGGAGGQGGGGHAGNARLLLAALPWIIEGQRLLQPLFSR